MVEGKAYKTSKIAVRTALTALLVGACFTFTIAQKKMTFISVKHIEGDLAAGNADAAEWQNADAVAIGTYWSGTDAPSERHFTAKLLWSDTALYVRFEAAQGEPLVVNDKPDLSQKAMGLWDRDVCEIFIATDKAKRNKYFEFEIAPTGEWIDLGIEVKPKERVTDQNYRSGMTSTARIDKDKVVMSMRLPFAALGKKPKIGDVWLGNLLRCVGSGSTRGYLAWRPTKTKKPAFHVPSAFGEFRFVK